MTTIIRAFVQSAPAWRQDIKRFSRHGYTGKRPDRSIGTEAWRCRQAYATARHLGMPVGVVTTVEHAEGESS